VTHIKSSDIENVWDAIEDDPADAQSLKLRYSLMIGLEKYIKFQD
jgi:predicted XRE-type DNA-binding protein